MRPRLVTFLNEISPVSVFNWLVPTPNQMYAITFLVVAIVFYKRSRQSRFPGQVVITTIWLGGIGAFLGAKLLFVLLHLKSYLILPSHIFAAGGSVSFGAYAGALIVLTVYLRYRKEPVLTSLDIAAATLPLGTALGRLSCLLNGDDFGKLTNAVWGVRYPQGSYPFAEQVSRGLISPFDSLSLPVHPNQLYLAFNALLIFFVVSWVWKKYRGYPGVTISLYAILYCATRFGWEFFRDEPTRGFAGLIFPQYVCLGIVMMAIPAAIHLARKYRLSKFSHHKFHSPITERIQP